MLRREVLLALSAAPLLASATPVFAAPSFDPDYVARLARVQAGRPYQPPPRALPPRLQAIDYDAYRAIRFRPDHALWRAEALPFRAQFFHRGSNSPERVDIAEVAGGRPTSIPYDPSAFTSDKVSLAGLPRDLGFAGVRLTSQINRPGVFDEIGVFQGASYFRSLGRDQAYGLSARGLALNTVGDGPEEFPIFRAFWLERPGKGDAAVRVHALLDSPSAAGAFSFRITPGASTVFEVDARLYPRRDLATAGIAPATSMFLFGPASARRFDDFRPAVHDSDGLQIVNGRDERLWRPLVNPASRRLSVFQDSGPHGFGLIQRARGYGDYQDLEARYDLRPSLWIEPLDDWGPGAVMLMELPASLERQDNIVAFWRPAQPLAAGREHRFRYRMSWGPPPSPAGLAEVRATRTGLEALQTRPDNALPTDVRLFSIDFGGPGLNAAAASPQVTASAGTISAARVSALPDGAARLDFAFDPGLARLAELRATLTAAGAPVSESWMYQWTP